MEWSSRFAAFRWNWIVDAAMHGVPHQVKSIPDELEIVQRGKRPGHHKIRPKFPMTVERFEELLMQVVLESIA